MKGVASAFQILGLEPGADHAAVEGAYRALIKRFHPDRPEGDVARAAAINHAYALLSRRERARAGHGADDLVEPLYARRAEADRRKRRKALPWGLLSLLALVGLGLFEHDQLARLLLPQGEAPAKEGGNDRRETSPVAADPADSAPVRLDAVRQGVLEAQLLIDDEVAALERSGDCYQAVREAPSFDRLDRCIAFDDAMLMLAHEPLAQNGPFGPTAITARQLSASRLLIGDFRGIEGRLDRVRNRVAALVFVPGPAPNLSD